MNPSTILKLLLPNQHLLIDSLQNKNSKLLNILEM